MATTTTTTGELPRPASPRLASTLFPSSSSSRYANAGINQVEERREGKGGRRNKLVIARGVDLIVSVGKEIRITNLTEYKGRLQDVESDLEKGKVLGPYKVLNTPAINFEIRQLVLNPTNKLLAVVGYSELAIVVLPRTGWSNLLDNRVDCRHSAIGKFYHSLPTSPIISQVQFHPWSENGAALLVLTRDGLLREYTINEDPQEPSQTIDFLASNSTHRNSASGYGFKSSDNARRGRGGFSADDINASRAVAFCLGEGKGDWGPLTIYGLMKNGDITAISPFLPKKASIPASYIHSLAHFISVKVDYLADLGTSTSLSDYSSTLNSDLSSLYAQQLKYVNSLLRQIQPSPSNPTTQDVDNDEEEDTDRLISITSPALLQLDSATNLKPQGPFLLQPSPIDLETPVESFACDINYVNYESRESGGQEGGRELGIFILCYTDGKVDIGLEVEKIEASWMSSHRPSYRQARGGQRGQLSHSNGVEEDHEEEGLPMMAIYETIDLGLSSVVSEARVEETLRDNWMTVVKDPLYQDVIYIYHSLGTHCLLLSQWLESITNLVELIEEDADEGNQDEVKVEVEKGLKSSTATEVLWILKTVSIEDHDASTPARVEGVTLVNDIYLGYSILMMTTSLQLVAIELSLRVDPSLLSIPALPTSSTAPMKKRGKGIDSDPPAYLSLLDIPFQVPSILSSSRTTLSPVPRVAITSSLSAAAKSQLIYTPESLRFMGKTVEKFRYEIRDLVSAADKVQGRLELQMKEMSRQLCKVEELRSNLVRSEFPGAGEESLEARVQRITIGQEKLLHRMDRYLQKLSNAHQPLLSTYEIKWFDELSRLEIDVLGGRAGKGEEEEDRGGLVQRVKTIEAKLDHLKPELTRMKGEEREQERVMETLGQGKGQSTATLGASQMHKLESMLSDEAKLIIDARRKIDRLTAGIASL